MAKKPKRPLTESAGPFNNPFAQLANLREEMGPADVNSEETPTEAAPVPAAGRILLQREKKGRAGKTVTRVNGLPEAAAFAQEIKRALGCGATVEGDDLILQGDQTERAAAFLRERFAKVIVGN